jgi:hypothetical protein
MSAITGVWNELANVVSVVAKVVSSHSTRTLCGSVWLVRAVFEELSVRYDVVNSAGLSVEQLQSEAI